MGIDGELAIASLIAFDEQVYQRSGGCVQCVKLTEASSAKVSAERLKSRKAHSRFDRTRWAIVAGDVCSQLSILSAPSVSRLAGAMRH